MANTLESDIMSILDRTGDKIRANMEREGVNASGRTSASIRTEQRGNWLLLLGGYNTEHSVADAPTGIVAPNTAPIPTLEVGRKGGGNPPVPKGFYYIIREWSREKGISFATEAERNTFSFFLSRKIAREGTQRHANHIDIYSTPVTEAKEEIKKAISNTFAGAIRAAISNVNSLQGAFT